MPIPFNTIKTKTTFTSILSPLRWLQWSVDIDKYRKNNIAWDSIDGLKARIVYPRQSGIGATGICFEKIVDNYNNLVLDGINLRPATEKLLLQVLKTIKFIKRNNTAANMWFSTMPAEEYLLIVPFAYHLLFGLNE